MDDAVYLRLKSDRCIKSQLFLNYLTLCLLLSWAKGLLIFKKHQPFLKICKKLHLVKTVTLEKNRQ